MKGLNNLHPDSSMGSVQIPARNLQLHKTVLQPRHSNLLNTSVFTRCMSGEMRVDCRILNPLGQAVPILHEVVPIEKAVSFPRTP